MKDKERITDPEELMQLARTAARNRMEQVGESETNPGGETREQIESTIKAAFDEAWKGGEYLRHRFTDAGHDLMISEAEYKLATRGSGLYDSTITSALKRFATPGKRISRRMVNGFYHITIADDLSKEAQTKAHDDAIRHEERARIKGLVAALAVDFAGNALTGIYKANLFAAIDSGISAKDIDSGVRDES